MNGNDHPARDHLLIRLRPDRLPLQDQGMAEVVDIPIEDGQRPAAEVTVELDDDGLPPHEAEIGGRRFELEPVAGSGPPWVYRHTRS